MTPPLRSSKTRNLYYWIQRENYSLKTPSSGRKRHSLWVSTCVKVNLKIKFRRLFKNYIFSTAYDEPYLVALLNDAVEVRTIQPTLLVQTMKISGAQLICYCSSGVIYISTGYQIYRVQSIPVARQIKMLLDERQFQLALQLCVIIKSFEITELFFLHSKWSELLLNL